MTLHDFAEAVVKIVAEQFGESLKKENSSFTVNEALCELKLFKTILYKR
jgi:hypothetical protein